MTINRRKTGLALTGLLVLLLFMISISNGSVKIPLRGIAGILLQENISQDDAMQIRNQKIVLELRLPRALAAAFGGAALALSGLLLQTFFRNPLAGPDVLGIASGAGLGAAVTILAVPILKTGGISVLASSVAGSLIVTALLIGLVKKYESMTITLLAGLLTGYFLHSLTGILIRFSSNQAVRSYINWSAGSFRNISREDLGIFLPLLASSFLASFLLSKQCDLYLLGEDYALSMGSDTRKFRISLILLTSVMTGAVTALCGPVSFIGIAAPHFCRMALKTDRHSILIPGVIFTGAALALAADTISALPGSGIMLPLNSVTAIIGTPVVIKVLLKGYYER
ncbi:MAG: iron ABC transporter permease [Spirochaetia bacterium]|jgi:iron complex transport system permease protein|nr:iron ABC transporter permease [Spirochaetia bacterium]